MTLVCSSYMIRIIDLQFLYKGRAPLRYLQTLTLGHVSSNLLFYHTRGNCSVGNHIFLYSSYNLAFISLYSSLLEASLLVIEEIVV